LRSADVIAAGRTADAKRRAMRGNGKGKEKTSIRYGGEAGDVAIRPDTE